MTVCQAVISSIVMTICVAMSGCSPRPQPQAAPETPELWCWHHSLLNTTEAVRATEAFIDQAQEYGYTGIVFWDASFTYLNSPTWPAQGSGDVREAMSYAVSKGMKVAAVVAPLGYSNDILNTNPNWAEAQRVEGARFEVDGQRKSLRLLNSFSGIRNGGFESGWDGWGEGSRWLESRDRGTDIDSDVHHGGSHAAVIRNAPGNGRFSRVLAVTPWRQYHVRLYVKTEDYAGPPPVVEVFDAANNRKLRLYAQIKMARTQDFTQFDATFNSQDSGRVCLYFGEWGGSAGSLWFDDISVEETALIYVVRRPTAPLKLYDPATGRAFIEGKDYNFIQDPALTGNPKDGYHEPPAVTLPAGTSLQPGQVVALDYYAAQPVHDHQLGLCLTDPGAQRWVIDNARKVTSAVPASTGYFLGYDEMRQMNSCASCRAKKLSAGQLLAWHAGETIQLYGSLQPDAPIYVWSDMFDPYANAHDDYELVEGDLAGSWRGLPAGVTIMNWNLEHLRDSLRWFAGQDSRQPVAHRQIIAGYYDNHEGANAATVELLQAHGVPGIVGLMYTTWMDDNSQLQAFAAAAKNSWAGYRNSLH